MAHPKPCWQGANSWSSQPIFLCPKHRRTIKSLSILSCGLPNSHQQRHRALLTQLWASPQGVAELDASGQHDKKQHQSKEAEASAEGGNGNGVEPGQGTQVRLWQRARLQHAMRTRLQPLQLQPSMPEACVQPGACISTSSRLWGAF